MYDDPTVVGYTFMDDWPDVANFAQYSAESQLEKAWSLHSNITYDAFSLLRLQQDSKDLP